MEHSLPLATPCITVCIATYKRPEQLNALLTDLTRQTLPPAQIVVVDNDPDLSARPVLKTFQHSHPTLAWVYDTQPEKNISLTRNRCLEQANGEWLAFVDDDERVAEDWIEQLLRAAQAWKADGVLGPVISLIPEHAPSWIKRGSFYDRLRFPTGTRVPNDELRIGNALLAAQTIQATRFDPRFGLTGGEDNDFLLRLVQQGAHLVWSDEAVATEPVAKDRLKLGWLLARALRGGQDYAHHFLAGKYGGVSVPRKALFFMRALVQALISLCLIILTWPFGMHHGLKWLTKAAANTGKLSAFFGCHYKEYA